ncbi:MAG: hypothetical protein LUF26_03740 [Firmicutes bacterium]|nr:hypothetical protein [Bacillota bacterium]
MINQKCPNCGAAMQLSADEKAFVCPYCDTTTPNMLKVVLQNLNSSPQNNTAQTVSPVKALFDVRCVDFGDIKAKKVWEQLCRFINETRNTAESYITAINNIAGKSIFMSNRTTNPESMRIAETVVSQKYTAGENSVVFLNYGVFSKGKDGVLISDKAMYKVKKTNVTKIAYSELHSLLANTNALSSSIWHVNGESQFKLYADPDPRGLSLILGLVCTLARDAHPAGYKIVIDNK